MAEMVLRATGSKLKIISEIHVTSTQAQYDTCLFEFDEAWDGYGMRTAVFYSNPNNIKVMILDTDNRCFIPWDAFSHSRYLYIGVYGSNGKSYLPSQFVEVMYQPGANIDDHLYPPTPGIYEQVSALLSKIGIALAEKASQAEYAVLKTQVEALASGGPRGVYTTLAELQTEKPTGDSYTYVVKSDGNWYYWDGAAWVSGGSYQAALLAISSVQNRHLYGGISPDKIEGISYLANLFNKDDPSNIPGHFIHTTTQAFMPHQYYTISHYIPVTPGKKYTVTRIAQEGGVFYDDSHNFVSGLKFTSAQPEPYTITVPSNPAIAYFRYNVFTQLIPIENYMFCPGESYHSRYVKHPGEASFSTLAINEDNVKPGSIKNLHLSEKIFPESILDSKPAGNKFNANSTSNQDGAFILMSTGEFVANENYVVSHFIPVNPGERLIASRVSREAVAFYNQSQEFLSGMKFLEDQAAPFSFYVPSDPSIRFLRINIYKPHTPIDIFVLLPGNHFNPTATYGGNKLPWLRIDGENTGSTLYGKKLLVSGDSITEQNRGITKWHTYLSGWLGLTVMNDGYSGTGLIRTFSTYDGMLTRMDTWNDKYGTFDGIVIMGNMNDCGLGSVAFPVGSFTDQPYPAVTSQYAVLHAAIQKILGKWPNKPLCWVISTPRRKTYETSQTHGGKGWGEDGFFEPYAEAIRRVCAHYSIPCLDLYHGSGLRPWIDQNNETFFVDADGTHPNSAGQLVMAQKIRPFVEQYL